MADSGPCRPADAPRLGCALLDEDTAPTSALASAHMANWLMCGDQQEVEFLAERLMHGPSPYPELDVHDGMAVLLGSPLFVALAD
ncbi:DUF7019 family protein [Saccharopolyspora sp. NPDC003752]